MDTEQYATAGMAGSPAPRWYAPRVRRAAPADAHTLAQAIARAFFDDPVASWIFKDDSRRMRRLERGFEVLIRQLYLPHDECHTTDDVAGGALWLPPGEWRSSLGAQLGLLPRLARACGSALPRLLRQQSLAESKHPHEPHYYLPFAGVEPGRQGRGIGGALIRPILERCDRDGTPAYLEATAPRNRVLYERHGFETIEAIELPKNGPPMWLMWREPAR